MTLAVDAGTANVGIGQQCLESGNHGDNNVAIGWSAGEDLTGENNVWIGTEAGREATSADQNTVIGYQAAANYTGHQRNTIIGYQAASGSDGGENNNTIIGWKAGLSINANDTLDNVIIGKEAGTGGTGKIEFTVIIGSGAMNSSANQQQSGTVASICHLHRDSSYKFSRRFIACEGSCNLIQSNSFCTNFVNRLDHRTSGFVRSHWSQDLV